MIEKIALLGVAVACIVPFAENAQAEEKEPTAVIKFGVEGERTIPGGAFNFGPTTAVEFTVIKDWLSIEVGGASLFTRAPTEWEGQVIFKKPFDLSQKVELMVGAGPSWSYAKGETGKTGATFMLDFMIWPQVERKFGWFVEQSFTYSLSKDHEKSLSLSVGLLIAIP
jgi:hypothetical protein